PAVRLAHLGHGARHEGAARVGHGPGAPDAGACERVAGREPDLPPRRLVDPEPRARARRLGLRVRQRLVPGRGRLGGHPDGAGPAPDRRHTRRQARPRLRLNWTLGMQSRSGGWGAFDTDNTAEFLNRIPFADMEAMIDPPTEDLAGRLLNLMGICGYGPDFGRARRALEFVRRTQRADGSWWGRWGVNFIYGTWSVLDALAAIGEDLRAPYVRRAVEWLRARQNADGGWGETVASYDDESLAGKGESTASQTAWAVL